MNFFKSALLISLAIYSKISQNHLKYSYDLTWTWISDGRCKRYKKEATENLVALRLTVFSNVRKNFCGAWSRSPPPSPRRGLNKNRSTNLLNHLFGEEIALIIYTGRPPKTRGTSQKFDRISRPACVNKWGRIIRRGQKFLCRKYLRIQSP